MQLTPFSGSPLSSGGDSNGHTPCQCNWPLHAVGVENVEVGRLQAMHDSDLNGEFESVTANL